MAYDTFTGTTAKPPDEMHALWRDVFVRMQRLRSTVKEVARSRAANASRDIVETTDALKTTKRDTYVRLIDILDHPSLRPEHGRRKDLKRIGRTITSL